MKKKKVWLWLVLGVLAVALISVALYANWFHSHKILIGDVVYDKDITQLDLTGSEWMQIEDLQKFAQLRELDVRGHAVSVDEYESLREALPECRILWLVPFQGSRLEESVQEISITELAESDIGILKYLPALREIDAVGCYDYDLLEQLKAERTDLQVHYTVKVGDADYDPGITELEIENPDATELMAVLLHLPQLKDVYLTGAVPANEEIYEMMCLRQDVVFHWDFELFGVPTSSTATKLILNDIPMDSVDLIEDALKYFYNLQWVEMCNCGIPSEEMDALWKRHPETRFVWTIHIRDAVVRTDIIGLIPIKLGYYMGNRLKDEDCTELKYLVDMVCLDMGHMDISDCSFLEYMPKLKYLILIDTKCKDFSALVHCKELIYLELFYSDFTQTELLLELPKLQDLNLGSTARPDLDVLKQMTYLDRLWIPNTGIRDSEYRELQKAMPDTQIVMYVEHSTAGNWRDNDNYRDMRDILGMGYMK